MMSGAPTPDPATRHPDDTGAATPATPRGRMDALDVARGLALLAMAVYHLSWDLRWFGLVDWPVDSSRGWRIFAGLIAGSFLVLVGVGLVLAHGRGIRWRKALVRAGCCCLSSNSRGAELRSGTSWREDGMETAEERTARVDRAVLANAMPSHVQVPYVERAAAGSGPGCGCGGPDTRQLCSKPG